jgi:1-phosphatidylinositol phosphodiesterase
MKTFFRVVLYILLLPFIGFFLLLKKYGNTKYKLEGTTIIVANHYSDWDSFIIYMLYGFKHKLYFFTSERVKHNFWTKLFCLPFNCLYVYVDPIKNIKLFKESIKLLKEENAIIVIFPEGAINDKKDGFMMFHESFAFIAKKANSKILPLYIYPSGKFLMPSDVFIGNILTPDEINKLDDPITISMVVQSRIMDYSCEVDDMKKELENNKKHCKNKVFFPIFFGALTTLMSIFALIPINAAGENSLTNWMSKLDDSTNIREMSIPGTHDSAATHSIADLSGRCQDLTIKEQLNIGVRFLDLRLQMVNNRFKLVHSFVDQKLPLENVVSDLVAFIRKHNDEFIIISIKKDESDVNSDAHFETLLKTYFEGNEDVISYDKTIPNTLGEARGKIYIMDRYGMSIGVTTYFSDNTTFETEHFHIQDYYCINNVDDKINAINNTLEYSKTHSDKLTFNFSSCYIDGIFPPTYAGTSALPINNYLIETFKEDAERVGVMVLDFVGANLTKLIIGGNK